MTKFSNKLKKSLFWGHFWSISPNFLGKKSFQIAPCKKLEQTHDTIQEKAQTEGRTDGQTDTILHDPATARGAKKTNSEIKTRQMLSMPGQFEVTLLQANSKKNYF